MEFSNGSIFASVLPGSSFYWYSRFTGEPFATDTKKFIIVRGFLAHKVLIVIIVLGTASLLSVFRRSQAQESSSATSAVGVPQGAGSPSAANAKLEEAVKSMLRSDEQLRQAKLKVDADVTKNEVTLSGTVESDATRAKAAELAKAAHVGVVVNNRITVRPRHRE